MLTTLEEQTEPSVITQLELECKRLIAAEKQGRHTLTAIAESQHRIKQLLENSVPTPQAIRMLKFLIIYYNLQLGPQFAASFVQEILYPAFLILFTKLDVNQDYLAFAQLNEVYKELISLIPRNYREPLYMDPEDELFFTVFYYIYPKDFENLVIKLKYFYNKVKSNPDLLNSYFELNTQPTGTIYDNVANLFVIALLKYEKQNEKGTAGYKALNALTPGGHFYPERTARIIELIFTKEDKLMALEWFNQYRAGIPLPIYNPDQERKNLYIYNVVKEYIPELNMTLAVTISHLRKQEVITPQTRGVEHIQAVIKKKVLEIQEYLLNKGIYVFTIEEIQECIFSLIPEARRCFMIYKGAEA